ncbi:MAG: hypothetical protein KIT45_09960 [Fimbriimonadia bacterium]|nr:hypothetical protein [Fimbriimonadia bacterium]
MLGNGLPIEQTANSDTKAALKGSLEIALNIEITPLIFADVNSLNFPASFLLLRKPNEAVGNNKRSKKKHPGSYPQPRDSVPHASTSLANSVFSPHTFFSWGRWPKRRLRTHHPLLTDGNGYTVNYNMKIHDFQEGEKNLMGEFL